jgi:hypothetical protein
MKLVVTFESINALEDYSDLVTILYEKNGKKATLELPL